MPFDPTKPANNSPDSSAEMRGQLNALKALIDGVQSLANALVPIGVAYPWFKSLTGVPALPANFVECNGQVLSDGESPLDTQTIPDLNNTQSFLRGAPASGGTGGADSHTHEVDSSYSGVSVDSGGSGIALDANPKTTSAASSLPPFYEVVWVMRVK